MHYKFLISTSMVMIILMTGCSMEKWFVYHPDINQGNYLSVNDVIKIKKGMTQQQVVYVLGTPTLKEPFSRQVWHYVFRQEFSHKKVKQQILTLIFDCNNVVVDIKNSDNFSE